MKMRAWLFVFLLCAGAVFAQDSKVRTHVEASDPLWVGQKATLVVELLTPGIFSGSPTFDLPQVPGMLLFAPEGSPVVGSETVDGASYTVQRHEIALFAKRAGDFTIPAFAVRFNAKRSPLDKDAELIHVKTDEMHLAANMPPGAENASGLISARNLKAVESWKPEPGKAIKVGDAFTRTITFTAPDLPGMAFPPFPANAIDGMGIYPKTPVVQDKSNRGEVSGERSDAITYVCQRPGRFVIPAARLTWWDLDAQKLQAIDFPARTFDVAPNPAMLAKTADATPKTFSRQTIIILLASLFGMGVVATLLWKSRSFLRQLVAFLRPVHLAPLNPPQKRQLL